MIQKIQIQNFQAHTDSLIGFGPGVNVIRGSSDNGKSSIIRAMYWALFNRPSGTGFFKWGATTPTSSRLYFQDGAIVLREKDKKTNFYMRRESAEDTNQDKFQALRTDVPAEISEVHQMELFNIQRQHDRYFLLQDSPGEVGRQLNEVTNLSIIGETLSAANRYVGAKKTIIGQLVAERQSLENQFHALPPVAEVLPHIEKCVEQAALLSEITKARLQITAIWEDREARKARLAAFPDIAALLPTMQTVTENLGKLSAAVSRSNAVSSTFSQYTKTANLIKKLPNVAGLANTFLNITDMLQQQAANVRLRQQVMEVSRRYTAESARVQQLRKAQEDAEQDMKTFKEQNPLCPLCSREWENL